MTTIPTGGGNEGPKRTDLSGMTRAPRPGGERGGAEAGAARAAASSLHLSAPGERFLSLRARLDTLDSSRADRVAQLRDLVASGRYRPSAEAIAAEMLDDPAPAAALGAR